MKAIRNSNIIKYTILAIIITSLVRYDAFKLVNDNISREAADFCNALMWVLSSFLTCYLTFVHYANFVWTKRIAFIFFGLTVKNLADELFQENKALQIGEWVFVVVLIICTIKYIKNEPSPTNTCL